MSYREPDWCSSTMATCVLLRLRLVRVVMPSIIIQKSDHVKRKKVISKEAVVNSWDILYAVLGHKHQNHPNRVSQRMTQFFSATAAGKAAEFFSIFVYFSVRMERSFQTFSLDSPFLSAVAGKTIDRVLKTHHGPLQTKLIWVTFVAATECRCRLHGLRLIQLRDSNSQKFIS